jgi:hypothetical protein
MQVLDNRRRQQEPPKAAKRQRQRIGSPMEQILEAGQMTLAKQTDKIKP